MPTTELFDIDWRETSFVPAGDNPPARIVLWKNDPGLTDAEVEEILEEVSAEQTPQRKGVPVTTTMTKLSIEAEVQKRAEELMKARPELTRVSARLEIWMELKDAYQEADEGEAVEVEASAPVLKAADPFAKLDAAAREELPEIYRRSPSMARVELSKLRPDLAAAYHGAHGAR